MSSSVIKSSIISFFVSDVACENMRHIALLAFDGSGAVPFLKICGILSWERLLVDTFAPLLAISTVPFKGRC